MVASVGPYMAHNRLFLSSLPPNSRITASFNISPIVNSNCSVGTFSLFRNKLAATVGVSSQASTSISEMTPGKSFNISLRSTLINVLPRSSGKKISNTETSKVGAANWRKRENAGTCRSWASNACVTAE